MNYLLTILLLCASWFSFSQSCVKGTVVDFESNEAIPHAKIYFPENNIVSFTDESGFFSVCNLEQGIHTIEIIRKGYKTNITEIEIQKTNLEIQLKLIKAIHEYPEVFIYAGRLSRPEETPNNITSLSTEEMRESGAFNLSDGIAKIPGVSQLSTGIGISKPVIRGLYGNRIQTVMLGMRFDNQQWQDEHGLGLSDVGIDRIEIIKGPASLLYGSEAMGGVLNIIEEKPAAIGTVSTDISTRFFSNTFGNATDIGVKGANTKFNWRIRAGIDSHADYTDGNDKRILNSRFGGYYLKSSFGFTKKNWISQNNYMFTMNNFGFLMEASMANLQGDNRQSRKFDMPHHTVFLNVLSSQNTLILKKSKLKFTLGAQVNDRQEQEGGNKISLNMLLNSYSSTILWIKKIKEKSELSLASESMYQTNRNIGSRTIVPDANLFESSFSTYFKATRKYFVFESGLRYGIKHIQTFTTGNINSGLDNPGLNILPFNKLYNTLNGSVGISLFDSKHWNLKTNISSGYRTGNLAELSSNGLHEGSVRYEIGDVNLKTEQNVCGDLFLAYDSKNVSISGSIYLNKFYNYIYLAPTTDEYIGYQIFRYIQKDASFKGTESTIEIHPTKLKWIVAKSSYSIVIGQTKQGEYLPFIPAQKINSELKFLINMKKRFKFSFFKIGSDYVFAQNNPGQFETSTSSYYLFNAALGTTIENKKNTITVSISGTNLLNNAYYDHLSRFKYFGIYNVGRNISLNFKINF